MAKVFVDGMYVGEIPVESLNDIGRNYSQLFPEGKAPEVDHIITVTDKGKYDLYIYLTSRGTIETSYLLPQLYPEGISAPTGFKKLLYYFIQSLIFSGFGYFVGRMVRK